MQLRNIPDIMQINEITDESRKGVIRGTSSSAARHKSLQKHSSEPISRHFGALQSLDQVPSEPALGRSSSVVEVKNRHQPSTSSASLGKRMPESLKDGKSAEYVDPSARQTFPMLNKMLNLGRRSEKHRRTTWFGGSNSSNRAHSFVQSKTTTLASHQQSLSEDNNIPQHTRQLRRQRPQSTCMQTGWLVKQGGVRKNWKKRWFVLKCGSLNYYDSPTEPNPLGIIDIKDVAIFVAPELETKDLPNCFKIAPFDSRKRTYYLSAQTEDAMVPLLP
jgi:hypothetical protein